MENEVVYNRAEIIKLLKKRVDKPTEISDIVNKIETLFIFSNAQDEKVYVCEVSNSFSEEIRDEIIDLFMAYDIPVLIVPPIKLRYIATVTPKSMGVFDKIKSMKKQVRKLISMFGGK